MGRLEKIFLTHFQAALLNICSWVEPSQSCFYSPNPLILLPINRTYPQISLLTDSLLSLEDKTPCLTASNISSTPPSLRPYRLPPACVLPCYIHLHHLDPDLPSSPAAAVAVTQAHRIKARATLSDQTSPNHAQTDIVITADNNCLTKTETQRRIQVRDSGTVAR